MNKDELLKMISAKEDEWRKEVEANPLAEYSTTQLKKELRRRKQNE